MSFKTELVSLTILLFLGVCPQAESVKRMIVENVRGFIYSCIQPLGLGDVVVFENRQPVTAAKFINTSSLFILLPGAIRLRELKPISEQKVENILFAPPYCQTECCMPFFVKPYLMSKTIFSQQECAKKQILQGREYLGSFQL